jgi:hypothetical protein
MDDKTLLKNRVLVVYGPMAPMLHRNKGIAWETDGTSWYFNVDGARVPLLFFYLNFGLKNRPETQTGRGK